MNQIIQTLIVVLKYYLFSINFRLIKIKILIKGISKERKLFLQLLFLSILNIQHLLINNIQLLLILPLNKLFTLMTRIQLMISTAWSTSPTESRNRGDSRMKVKEPQSTIRGISPLVIIIKRQLPNQGLGNSSRAFFGQIWTRNYLILGRGR